MVCSGRAESAHLRYIITTQKAVFAVFASAKRHNIVIFCQVTDPSSLPKLDTKMYSLEKVAQSDQFDP